MAVALPMKAGLVLPTEPVMAVSALEAPGLEPSPEAKTFNPNLQPSNIGNINLFPSTKHLPLHDTKKYMYAYQTAGGTLPDNMKMFENRTNSDVMILTYKQDHRAETREGVHFVYGPNTTWTTGRNLLLQEIKQHELRQGWKYKYVTLMDHDIIFTTKSPLSKFERVLQNYEPAVGTAAIPGRDGDTKKYAKQGPILAVCAFDALFNAFHHEALDILLPYDQRYEAMSWYCSQQDIILRSSAMYKHHVLEVRHVKITNDEHSEYPKGGRYSRMKAAKEQQERFEAVLPRAITRCSRWPCEGERHQGEVRNKTWDYSDPTAHPKFANDAICPEGLFDRDLFDRDMFDRDLFDRDLFDHDLFDRVLFDRVMFDRGMFDCDMFDRDLFDHDLFDRDLFDHDMFDHDLFDHDLFDHDLFDRDLFDHDLFDRGVFDL
eukprot:gene1901-2584_t